MLLVSLVVGCTFGRADPPPPAVLDTVPVVSEPLEGVVVEPRPGTCDFRGGTITEESTRCEVEATRFYVVSQVLYPEVSLVGGVERTAGLDLDGTHSPTGDWRTDPGCTVHDFVSPDGMFGGIDNQGASLQPTLDRLVDGGVDATAREAIAEGRFGAVIEIRNWNETADDRCVDVFVYDAIVDEPVLESGRLALDQTVIVTSAPRRFGYGHVRAGELRTGLGGFPIPQPLMADLHNAHLRLQLSETSAVGLAVGELPIDTGVGAITCSVELDEELVRSTAESVADLRPDADGVCTSLSWGVNIEAVRAVVE